MSDSDSGLVETVEGLARVMRTTGLRRVVAKAGRFDLELEADPIVSLAPVEGEPALSDDEKRKVFDRTLYGSAGGQR